MPSINAITKLVNHQLMSLILFSDIFCNVFLLNMDCELLGKCHFKVLASLCCLFVHYFFSVDVIIEMKLLHVPCLIK